MQAEARVIPANSSVFSLASLVFVAGSAGMAMSFVFLGSGDPLDVTAGAAGFVAGAVLVAAGLVSIAIDRYGVRGAFPATRAVDHTPALAPPLDVSRWVAHFQANRANRPEPDWAAPMTLPPRPSLLWSGRSNSSSLETAAGRRISLRSTASDFCRMPGHGSWWICGSRKRGNTRGCSRGPSLASAASASSDTGASPPSA